MPASHSVYTIDGMRFDVHFLANQEVQIIVGRQATAWGRIDANRGLVGTNLTRETVQALNRLMFPGYF